jgi:hypothetical protein
MALVQTLLVGVRPIHEFFTLRRAENTVRAYTPVQHERVQEHVDAAVRRLSGGRRATQSVSAAILLRDAVRHYLIAAEVARDRNVRVEEIDLAGGMPVLPPDPARPRAQPTDDARAREALASPDALYFDRLPEQDAERARWALDRAATMLRRRVEARSLVNLRGSRWGRVAAFVLIAGYAAFAIVRALVLPKDIAFGKPVHASSHRANTPDGHELVDGEIGTSFAVHTDAQSEPNVVIDLQDKYWIDTVKVYNRVDGWYDDCLPLVVELSVDGQKWDEIGRREEHFGASPPWVVNGGGKPAHFVRVKVARTSYLALSEVEVFGKKL